MKNNVLAVPGEKRTGRLRKYVFRNSPPYKILGFFTLPFYPPGSPTRGNKYSPIEAPIMCYTP